MIDLGPHAVFIVSSYLGAALVILALILWTALSSHQQKRRLAELEKRGIYRRSETTSNRKEE